MQYCAIKDQLPGLSWCVSESNSLWWCFLHIPHMEGAMFNIKFIYLKTADVTQDLLFSRVTKNTLKSQYKCKLYFAKYSYCNAQFTHDTNVIPITGLYHMLPVMRLGVPSLWEGIVGLMPSQAPCSLQNSLAGCLVFIFCVGLSEHSLSPCWSG